MKPTLQTRHPGPASDVLEAFGTQKPAKPLQGGQGTSYRAGDVVLKPVHNKEEAAWVAEVYSTLEPTTFRIPRPIASSAGAWVVSGWSAYRFVAGRESPRGRWHETLEVSRVFHQVLEGLAYPDFMDRRTDPWAVADRMTWGETPVECHAHLRPAVDRLLSLLRPLELPNQIIHGDISGNVLYADGLPPAVIDFAPYWHPAGFAIGIVIADAVVWGGADLSLFDHAGYVKGLEQLVMRAALRRLLEVGEHHKREQDCLGELSAHFPFIEQLEQRISSARR